jgi:hypothetical protein
MIILSFVLKRDHLQLFKKPSLWRRVQLRYNTFCLV